MSTVALFVTVKTWKQSKYPSIDELNKMYIQRMELIFSNKSGWGATIEMATHSSIFAWEVPWTEEPGGLQSMRSQKRWTLRSHSTTATKDRWTSKTHGDVKEARHKDRIAYDSIYMKCAENANLDTESRSTGCLGVAVGLTAGVQGISLGWWKCSKAGLWWWLHTL